MLRKAIIAVLTLATVGMVYWWVSADGRIYELDLDGERSIWLVHWKPKLGVGYVTIGDPSKPDIQLSWMYCGIKRARMYRQPDNVYSRTAYAAFCPSWLPTVLFGAYPTLAFIRGPLRRHRRRRKGECTGCGYDLTGNESGICPECGSKTHQPPNNWVNE